MAKSPKAIIFVASALCLLSFLSVVSADADDFDRFFVQGTVYCDTCRAQFFTRVSNYLKDAKVRLECKSLEGGNVTLSVEAVTDDSGTYSMEVTGDHEEEVCEIVLVKSPDPECSEVSHADFQRNGARISLTANDGIASNETRIVNALGFMRKEPLSVCSDVFRELGMTDEDIF